MGQCQAVPRNSGTEHFDDSVSRVVISECWPISCQEPRVLKAGADQDLIVAAKRGDIAGVRSALRGYADVNARWRPCIYRKSSTGGEFTRKNMGLSPLMFAARDGRMELVQLLLDERANVNAEEEDGYRALHFACMYGHPDVACLLIEHGANPDALTHSNYRPLDLCNAEDRVRFEDILS